jgi:hypothetical protein
VSALISLSEGLRSIVHVRRLEHADPYFRGSAESCADPNVTLPSRLMLAVESLGCEAGRGAPVAPDCTGVEASERASGTAPAGVSAISLTSRPVSTSLTRVARL